jgi:hypothetical protein
MIITGPEERPAARQFSWSTSITTCTFFWKLKLHQITSGLIFQPSPGKAGRQQQRKAKEAGKRTRKDRQWFPESTFLT